MRINLTKKDLVNLVYMQLGFSKQISENLIEEFFSLISLNLKDQKKIKISKFGTFSLREKKQRIGRNPKTKEEKKISKRNVILFKASKEFKQIKPKILNGKRRYYDTKNIELIKKVHFLLKEQGMTINGVKKILNNKEPLKLDESLNHSIKAKNLKNKLKKISDIIKELKEIK